jgi:Glycosyltransferase family 28 C-terminal domain
VKRPIGYYVHHHGDGHRQRALSLAELNPQRITLLGTGLNGRTKNVNSLELPDDRNVASNAFDGVDGAPSRPHALHYAPLNHAGIRARMGLIAGWISDAEPALLVVDVSVEVAMLARLCSVPVAFVRLNGRRDDPAHLEAFRAASLLIAPFDERLDMQTVPDWVREKTIYCPGIVRHSAPSADAIPRSVLVVGGRGGAPLDGSHWAAAATATPDYMWRVIGPAERPNAHPNNIFFAGWVEDPGHELAAAEIVVGSAGDGLVNAVISLEKPFICCPEPRPFDEQVEKARGLKAQGAALVLEHWPPAVHWPDLLASALRIDRSRLAALGDPKGSTKTLARLEEFADRQ